MEDCYILKVVAELRAILLIYRTAACLLLIIQEWNEATRNKNTPLEQENTPRVMRMYFRRENVFYVSSLILDSRVLKIHPKASPGSWSPTSLPIRLVTGLGGASHCSKSANDRVPEFSLQIKSILRSWASSSSRRARSSTAMDLDLPAPKRPWIHRSRRLVRSAIVTAHSAPITCPSNSAAKDNAIVRVQAWGSVWSWYGLSTKRSSMPHRCRR